MTQFTKVCMASINGNGARNIPVDVASAIHFGWRKASSSAAGQIKPQIAPDVPDNGNRVPFRLRLAYFYPKETVARYTNDSDGQASIEYIGSPPEMCNTI